MTDTRTSIRVPVSVREEIRIAAAFCTASGDTQTQSSWLARAVREQAAKERNARADATQASRIVIYAPLPGPVQVHRVAVDGREAGTISKSSKGWWLRSREEGNPPVLLGTTLHQRFGDDPERCIYLQDGAPDRWVLAPHVREAILGLTK